MSRIRLWQIASIALGIGWIAGLAIYGCSAAQRKAEERFLTIAASECVKVAVARGRNDIATACGITEAAADVIIAALDTPTVCAVGDAGVMDAGPAQ